MLAGAKREHKTVLEIAKFYTDAFFADCEKLHIRKPDTVVPATTRVPDFIHMVETLLEKGYAYEAGGNVYFDTSKLENYYVFGNQSGEDLAVGVRGQRVEEDANKRNKTDFVLWFTKSKFEDQELKWDSPGAWAIPAGTLSAAPSPCGSWGSTWTSTAAALTTPSPTTPTKSPRVRPTWATPGANTGSMCCTSTTPGAR